jgi:hypothetical protein
LNAVFREYDASNRTEFLLGITWWGQVYIAFEGDLRPDPQYLQTHLPNLPSPDGCRLGQRSACQPRRALTLCIPARPARWHSDVLRPDEGRSTRSPQHLLASYPLIPAKAGTSGGTVPSPIPAFAGMPGPKR